MARRIPIDWDFFELAFTMNSDEVKNCLDLRTGKVELAANEVTGTDIGLSEEEIETGFSEGYLVRVDPVSSQTEYRWMARFADTVADHRLRKMLELALNGGGAFRRFKMALADHPAERERWFAFHQDCLDEEMKEWLAGNDIEPTNPLPKRKRMK
jgi:NOL1/NOP2/fmu family ribosome biogenesis protein